MIFKNNSTAGSANIANLFGGVTRFLNSSTAGNANIDNGGEGSTQFLNNSTAGSANISNGGQGVTQFLNSSTAGNANITNFSTGSVTSFGDRSSAGSATIFGYDSTSTFFFNNSTAGSANIEASGDPDFQGATIVFFDDSTGGTARIGLSGGIFGSFHPGSLDISTHNAPGVTVGSIEGSGNVFLGGNNLTVGSNNIDTTFSGGIQDGEPFGGGGTGGSLTKIGSGTFILFGANTYTGSANVNRGVLQVDGSITSNTFVNHGGTLAGTGTINGNVTNNGRVSPGEALGVPGVLTVVHNYTQAQFATLMIQIAGASAGQFSVLDVMGNANLNGFLDPVLLNGFVPTIGDSFTFLNYARSLLAPGLSRNGNNRKA
jgi:autotransporter-associated beta strand protein